MLSFNVEKLTSSAKLTPFEHMGTASYYHNQGTGKSQLCFLSAICSAAPISWTRALLQQFKMMMMMEAAMAAAEAERKQAALAEKLTTSNKCSTAAEPRPHQSSQSSSTFHRERLLHAHKKDTRIFLGRLRRQKKPRLLAAIQLISKQSNQKPFVCVDVQSASCLVFYELVHKMLLLFLKGFIYSWIVVGNEPR